MRDGCRFLTNGDSYDKEINLIAPNKVQWFTWIRGIVMLSDLETNRSDAYQ